MADTPYLPKEFRGTREIVADLANERRAAIEEAGAINIGRDPEFFRKMVNKGGKAMPVRAGGAKPAVSASVQSSAGSVSADFVENAEKIAAAMRQQ